MQQITLTNKEYIEFLEKIEEFHPTDIANTLRKIRKESLDDFQIILSQIPEELLGEVLLKLPENTKIRASPGKPLFV